MSGRADDPAFAARLLAERAAALAARREDREPDPGTDTRGWLVCEISGTLFAVEAAAVAVLQPFRCRPVPLLRPGAAGVVLGVTLLEGRLCSVL
ncbi:MAG: hypothetical protein INR65_00945, partial [Gluconacetobacter diazotrophicus]|nr:hypothetical protein [Gluconacetobacter diazotrophicus]